MCEAHCSEPTGTLGLGTKRRPGGSGAPIQGPRQQDADLVFGVGVQVTDLVRGLVDGLVVDETSRHGAVLHLPLDDRAIPVDRVGVQLDPQVGGANPSQLGGCDGHWGFWEGKNMMQEVQRNALYDETWQGMYFCNMS